MKRIVYNRIRSTRAHMASQSNTVCDSRETTFHPAPPPNAWIMYERKGVDLTYDRHTAQWGDERCWGKAIGSEVPQFPDAHENHPAPPHQGGVVGLGASLRLTDMSIFLSVREREREQEATLRLSGSNYCRAAQGQLKHASHRH